MRYKKTIVLGLLTALGCVLQLAEQWLPVVSSVPGGKLGLANILTLVTLALYGPVWAAAVAVLRSCIASLLGGAVVSWLYSLSGAMLSAAVSAVLYRRCSFFSMVGIGIAAALAHNLAQVTLAAFLLGNTAVFAYYPVLMLVSVMCGFVTGASAQLAIAHLEK